MIRILAILALLVLTAAPVYAEEASAGVPLDKPNMNTTALLFWAAKTASGVMTFGFDNYDEAMGKSKMHFSPEEWDHFRGEPENAKMMKNAVNYQQIVTAAPASAPALLSEADIDGRYTWTVKTPLVVTFRVGSVKATVKQNLTLTIERADDSPDGLRIARWTKDEKATGQ